ncbi:MAG: sulfur oxidation c-type cytochrome SoxA [Alphaproteobacteria bacterium]|nr:sulfur oxidation c-type cytochrome SoxA [Alphaproteobacteria bacterium]
MTRNQGRRAAAGAAAAIAGIAGLVEVAAQTAPRDERRSGYTFMSPATQAMQRDDTANPGMLSVLEGGELWEAKAGAAGRSCADCHGDARVSMRGVAARYPAYDAARDSAIDLAGRIDECRTTRQAAPGLARESRPLLALTTFVAHQSRGLPITAGDDPRLAPALAAGRALYEQRMGQINLSCANCHDDNWGRTLGSAPIPQAHPTGYPIYRLEWQDVGSLQRRLRTCLTGVRAEPFAYGAPEYVAIELFLMSRARGMTLETPGVRP